MKTEYLFKMFLEFSKAYGINDTFNNFERISRFICKMGI